MEPFIRSFADRGTDAIFDGVDSEMARKTCPHDLNGVWHEYGLDPAEPRLSDQQLRELAGHIAKWGSHVSSAAAAQSYVSGKHNARSAPMSFDPILRLSMGAEAPPIVSDRLWGGPPDGIRIA
jgi:predicted HD phosphohydrolase